MVRRPGRVGLERGRAPVDAPLGGVLEVERGGVPLLEPPGKTADEVAQGNGGVDVVLDLDRANIGADGPLLEELDREAAGVEVGRQCPELQNAVGRLDAAADIFAAAVPLVQADELRMRLIENGLAEHHRGVGQTRSLEEVGELLGESEADQLDVADDHRPLRLFQHGRCLVECLAERLRVAQGRLWQRQRPGAAHGIRTTSAGRQM